MRGRALMLGVFEDLARGPGVGPWLRHCRHSLVTSCLRFAASCGSVTHGCCFRPPHCSSSSTRRSRSLTRYSWSSSIDHSQHSITLSTIVASTFSLFDTSGRSFPYSFVLPLLVSEALFSFSELGPLRALSLRLAQPSLFCALSICSQPRAKVMTAP